MAISTYSELKTAIADWMARSDVSGSAADFITLAEARLNRLVGVVSTDATVHGISGSRYIDISDLSMLKPLSLHITDQSDGEIFVTPRAGGSFAYRSVEACPTIWTIDNDRIAFDCLLDVPYSFRLNYQGRFALSDAAPTNDLLRDSPDVYLAASMLWGGAYIKDMGQVSAWKSMLDEFILETRSINAQSKRSLLQVDAGLLPYRGCQSYDGGASLPSGTIFVIDDNLNVTD